MYEVFQETPTDNLVESKSNGESNRGNKVSRKVCC
jgi:hypothetical protein